MKLRRRPKERALRLSKRQFVKLRRQPRQLRQLASLKNRRKSASVKRKLDSNKRSLRN